jgi:hypothetical protein
VSLLQDALDRLDAALGLLPDREEDARCLLLAARGDLVALIQFGELTSIHSRPRYLQAPR